MSSDNAWSVHANEALEVSLVNPSDTGLKTVATFHPKFTYPIFGDEEQIFGYQNLKINLYFNANDMRPCLTVSYGKKFKSVGETEATDIKGILRGFLPSVAFQSKSDFERSINSNGWKPPGNLLTSFESKGAQYEVWKGNVTDPAVRQILDRIQILVPLLVEGGRYINTDDPDADRWTIFFLYQKRPSAGQDGRFSYVFTGYTTVYRFFFFQPPTPPASPSEKEFDRQVGGRFDIASLPCRSRISQFIIIPPFQRNGLGDRLYRTVFQEYLNHPQTLEITVEDPNETFDDLRDIADIRFLRQMPGFNALCINRDIAIPTHGLAPSNIVERSSWEAVRKSAKLAPRQFARVLEMQLMSKLPESVRPGIVPDKSSKTATVEEQHEYLLWRLLVKQRIYRHNKDTLGQLEVAERIDKLEETVSNVEFDYARLLAIADGRDQGVDAGPLNEKRKLDDDDHEGPASKKVRLDEE